MIKPKRVSIGCYAVKAGGKTIVIQRLGRTGFKIVMRRGALSPRFRRLRDAVVAAVDAADPWPFDVPKPFDGPGDIPAFLRRTK